MLHFSLSVNSNHRRKHKLVGLGNHHVLFFFIVAVGKLGFRPVPVGHLAVIVGAPRENRAVGAEQKHERVAEREGLGVVVQANRRASIGNQRAVHDRRGGVAVFVI